MVKKKNCYKKYGTLFSGDSNPFNVKVNRKKHAVLGSDVKGTKGQPAISKGLNYAKRKEFLKKNKMAAQKTNTYIDKRSKNLNSSLEEQFTVRFGREQQKKSKKSVFNLSTEKQDLRTLSNDYSISSDEEERALGASFRNKDGFPDDSLKSHKEIMEEMIADSKQKKMERKMEKEKYLNSLEEVDNAWKKFSNSRIIPPKSASKILPKEPVDSSAKDSYHLLRNELIFAQKRSSISHTKSEEEILKEEERKRIQLEKDKLSRMNDNYEANSLKTSNHMSADAICDEYDYLLPVTTEDRCEMSERNYDDKGEESDASQSSLEEMDHQPQKNFESEDEMCEDDSFVSDVPNNINDFKSRVKDCDVEQLSGVLENIVRKYTRSKNKKVLAKLENFFEILLHFALECCNKKIPDFELIGALPPCLHSLANSVSLSTAHRFLKVLDEEQSIFTALKKRRMKKNFPRLQTIVILKYAVLIYSTSDYRHPVITPALIFMCDILGTFFCFTFVNVISRLLISEFILNCIADSKRFVPEAVHFLSTLLQLAVPKQFEGKKNLSRLKQFDLIINNKISSEDVPSLDFFVSNKGLTDECKKMGIIFAVVNQLLHFATLYSQLPSFKEIFAPALNICNQLPVHLYPIVLETLIKQFVELGQKSVPLRQLSFQRVKPKPLKMFEPRFECKFNQTDDINKKRKQIKKVQQKIKKEEKSILREIRKNSQVVASEKLKEKLELDAERKRKVKEIYSNLSVQEGEFKKMMKKKS